MSLAPREMLRARLERCFRMAGAVNDPGGQIEKILTMMDELTGGTGFVMPEPPPDKIIQLLDSGLVLTQAGAVYTSTLDFSAPRATLTLVPVTIQVQEDEAPGGA